MDSSISKASRSAVLFGRPPVGEYVPPPSTSILSLVNLRSLQHLDEGDDQDGVCMCRGDHLFALSF